MQPSLHVVLPAYNEAEALPSLLGRFAELELADWNLRLWVVDDGSADATADIALEATEKMNVVLLQHEQNMGLGQAVLTGLRGALTGSDSGDIIVVMDADDTHDVTLIRDMIARIESGADIVIASRYVQGGDDTTAPAHRRMLSKGAAMVFRTMFPLDGFTDFTSGYRAYRADLLRAASDHWGERLVEERGFACMVELLLKLRHWRPVIEEVPLVLRYDRKLSASKLRIGKTIGQYLALAARDRLVPAPRFPRVAKRPSRDFIEVDVPVRSAARG